MGKVNLEGHSNATGFFISDPINKITVKTKKFRETSYAAYCNEYLKKKQAVCRGEWHSCEHRLALIIERKKELTLETLKTTLDHHPRCCWGKRQVHFLRIPSQEKLEETLRVGQEYYKKLEQKQAKTEKPEA